MKILLIYDQSGRVLATLYGEESAPESINTMLLEDVPENVSNIEFVDVSVTPHNPVYAYYPDTDVAKAIERERRLREDAEGELSNAKIVAMEYAKLASDSEALSIFGQYPGAYLEWNPNQIYYMTGDRVSYAGKLYKVLQGHTSQSDWTPEDAHSLFAVVRPDGIFDWEPVDSTTAYEKGARVYHNGVLYESLIDGNVFEPGTIGTHDAWAVVKDA